MLTAKAVKSALSRDRPYKLADGRGLYLEVRPNGGRWWRFRYRFGGSEQLLSLGTFPDVSLAEARDACDDARRQLREGINPSTARKAARVAQGGSFKAVAEEWYTKRLPTLAPATARKIAATLANDLYPWLGHRPINELEAPEILAALRRIEHRGAIESAHRARQHCSQVFRYAVACGYCQRDPAADLRGALAPIKTTHRAALTEPAEIVGLLRAIEGYGGAFVVKCALRLLPLVFTRPGELRRAHWSEIDFEGAVWDIPAARMKMRQPHRVPLSAQALAILRELYPLTSRTRFVFPSERSRGRPISENTLNAALRRMGYTTEQMTAHGFRAMASTRLHELGFQPPVIEAQLAHAKHDKVAAAYNRAKHWPERVRMMNAWGDYLDALKAGEQKVVPLKRGAHE